MMNEVKFVALKLVYLDTSEGSKEVTWQGQGQPHVLVILKRILLIIRHFDFYILKWQASFLLVQYKQC